MRGKDLESESRNHLLNTKYQSYGPFPNGKDLKIALSLVRKIFPFRDNCLPFEVLPTRQTFMAKKVKGSSKISEGLPDQILSKGKTLAGKPCFNRQLGLCPGVCKGEISLADYKKIISRLKMFFAGRLSSLRSKLEQEMKAYAKKQEFEKAGDIKKQLFALDHIQDVALIKNNSSKNGVTSIRLEAYDIAHLSGSNTVGAMTVWQNNEATPSEYRRFQIKNKAKDEIDDLKNLAEILSRRLGHTEWRYPDVVIVDGDERARKVAEKILREKDLVVSVIAVTKDKHHKAAQLLGDSRIIRDYHQAIIATNAEAHRFAITYHRKKRADTFRS
jgi:excinuclease ABC subunit C